jgi:hypothetical protein
VNQVYATLFSKRGNMKSKVSRIGMTIGALCILISGASFALAPRDAGAWLICMGAQCFRPQDCAHPCNVCPGAHYPFPGVCWMQAEE